jgi:hypothetical protein
MADRLNQYPMLPNFNPTMLQPQHSQQVQQQSQGDSHGITNPEHSRIWQAMQQQQVQRDHYRAQNGGDMTGPPVDQQVSSLTL